MLVSLPIEEVLPELQEVLKTASSVVLRAPAGAGKTTRVPPALLNTGLAGSGQIVMLEPRRIAARTAARRIALERGERVGQTVGFRVRFDEAVSRETRILVVTEGILLRRLQEDPFLDGITVVVFDEFHERRLDSDLALAMARRVQQTVRPDLRLLVMSATMDPAPIAGFLGDCPIVESPGRMYPVRIDYLRRVERQPMTTLAVQGVERVLDHTAGDVLVFLPGVGEIMKTQRELDPLARRNNLTVLPLFGDQTAEEQDRVLLPANSRKVVLATNVAETSITIDGITAVVDTGFARQMQFDADVGLDRLELVPVSKAATDQRAGRAGRTQPGVCLRLWEESTQRTRPDFEASELQRIDLSSAVLRLRAWGEADPAEFPWFEKPPQASLEHAGQLLQLLGALDSHGVTDLGRILVRFPVPPRIGRLLVEGQRLGQAARCTLLAAMLTERDPFISRGPAEQGRSDRSGPPRAGSVRTVVSHRSRSDVLERLLAFEQFLQTNQAETPLGTINPGAARTIVQVAQQLGRILDELSGEISGDLLQPSVDPDEAVLQALVAAFPDRVARRRDTGSDRGVMVGGRGVKLGPRSTVKEALLFLCVDIDGRGAEALVRQASEVRREWLPPGLLRTADELFFHPSQKQVVARRRHWFADLLLDETPTAITDSAGAADILYQAARTQWSAVFPQDDEALTGFLTRVGRLADWMPELRLPAFDDAALQDVLRELCQGRRSFSELKQAPWLATLQSRMDYSTLQSVEREAPERLTVPSGNRIRLVYEPGRPPVLPVRIQEVFGWQQTPRIAGGRVAVLLHLLAPSMRPQQVTDDLASFWKNTYGEVRKELKRRYPKHAWPEDPLTAEAIRRKE